MMRYLFFLPAILFVFAVFGAPAAAGESSLDKTLSLLRSRYYSDRQEGERMLASLPDSAVPELVRLLDDPSPAVVRAAAVELAKRGEPSAVGPLKRLLYSAPDRYGPLVLPLLSRFGAEVYGKELLELLSPSSPVRDEAASCLAEMAAADAVLSARMVRDLAVLLHMRDFEARLAAEKGLSALGKAALPVLVEALEAPFPVCLSASSALSDMGGEAVGPLLDTALSGGGPPALYASLALSQMKCPKAAEALKRLFHSSPSPLVRANAVRGFALHRDAFSAAVAAAALRDSAGVVRAAALRSLAELDELPEGLDPALLAACLGDPSPDVRFAAVSACAKFRPPGAAAAWRSLLRDHDAGVALNAAWTAGLLGDDSLVAALFPLLRSGTDRLRLAAARSLLRLGSDAGEEILLSFLRKSGPDRKYALFALSAARDRRAVDAVLGVLPVLNDEERKIARYVLFSITGAPLRPAEWREWWAAERAFWRPSMRDGVLAFFKGRYYEKASLEHIAVKYYRAAVEAAPLFPDAHYALARLLAARGDRENLVAALAEVRKATALRDSAACRLLAAGILRSLGRTAEAAEEASRGLALAPRDPELLMLKRELDEELRR